MKYKNKLVLKNKIRMGNNSSKSKFDSEMEIKELQDKALINFNERVNAYSYPHHGSYTKYIKWCRAEYELECIPESCRYGNNYSGER
jgi:hypothetical protein